MQRRRGEFFDQLIPKQKGPHHTASPIGSLFAGAVLEFGTVDVPPSREAMLIEHAVDAAEAVRDLGDVNAVLAEPTPYVAMSVLQKAIRLNNPVMATRAARALVNSGHRAAALRRIRVIAVEDVGLGDPDTACFVLWLVGSKRVECPLSEMDIVTLAVDHLCAATKSRDMTDIATWLSLPGSVDAAISGFIKMPVTDLLDIATDGEATFRRRMAAVRALYPFRFKGRPDWKRRGVEDRVALYRRLGTSPQVAFMIERDVRYGGDVLTSTGALCHALLQASPWSGPICDPMDRCEPDVLNGGYASAYDRHTRIGKAAISDLLACHAPIIDFFRSRPRAHAMDCLMRAVFYVEGGVLRPRLAFEAGEGLYWAVLEAKFASTGLDLYPDGLELLDLTRLALPVLNDLRRKRAPPWM